MFPIDFQVKRSKVDVNLLHPKYCLLKSYDPLLDGYQTCYPGWLLKKDYPYRFVSQGQGQTTFFNYLSVVHNVLWNICLIITKLGVMITTGEQIIIIDFQVHMTKVLVNFALSVLID